MSTEAFHSNGHAKPASRGTIIIDTCTLLNLISPIPKELRKDIEAPEIFLDVLPLLAQQGYKILIPESDMYMLTSGLLIEGSIRSRDAYFEKGKELTKRSRDLHSKISHSRKKLSPFFKEVVAGEFPNIEIIPIDDVPGEAAEHLRKAKTLMRNLPDSAQNKRNVFMQLNEERPPELGDRVMRRMVKQMVSAPDTAYPLIILSDDGSLLKSLHNEYMGEEKLHLLNTPAFISAIFSKGVLRQWGIKDDTMSQRDLIDHVNRYKSRYNKEEPLPRSHVDSTCLDTQAPHYENDQPFATAMAGLAKELEYSVSSSSAQQEEPSPANPHGRAAKFREKYGKDYMPNGKDSTPGR